MGAPRFGSFLLWPRRARHPRSRPAGPRTGEDTSGGSPPGGGAAPRLRRGGAPRAGPPPAGPNDRADSAHFAGLADPAGAAPVPRGAASTGHRHRRGAPRRAALTAGPDQQIAWGPGCRVAAHTGSEPIGRTAVDGPVDAAMSSTTRSSGMPTACGESVWTRGHGGWCPPPTGSGYGPSIWYPGAVRRRRPEQPGDGETIRAGDHTSPAQQADPRPRTGRNPPPPPQAQEPSRSLQRAVPAGLVAVAANGSGCIDPWESAGAIEPIG